MKFKTMLFRKRKVFFMLLLSYILILILPIIISLIVYAKSREIVETEINHANGVMLKQLQQVIDSQLQNIENLCLEIAWNSRVKAIIYKHEPLANSFYYDTYKIVEDLKVYKASNGFIDDCYIFLKNTGTVITPSSHLDAELFYKIYHQCKEMPYNQWYEMVQSVHIRSYIQMFRKMDNGEVRKVIAYAWSLPIENPSQPVATVIILVDELKFLKTIQNIQWLNSSAVLILDNENRVLVSTGHSDWLPPLRYEKLLKSGELLHERINGEEVTVSYITSQVSKWKFISIVPSRILWEKAEYIRKLTSILIILSILVGGLVTYYFLRKNYNPINKLVQVLINKAGMPFKKGFDEYLFIQETISSTFDEKEKITQRLEQQNKVLRSNFIVGLLKGRLDDKIPIHEALSSFNIDFVSDYFLVMLVYIEDFRELFHGENNLESKEEYILLQFIITNVFEELIGQNNYAFMTEVDEMMVCLVNFKKQRVDNGKKEMFKIASEAQLFIQEKFRIYFAVAISDIHQTIIGIPEAYREALEAMEYKVVMGSQKIILYDDIKNKGIQQWYGSYYYPLQVEQKLINCIKVGDFDKSKVILENVFKKSFSDSSVSVQIAKCLMFDLISTVIKTINEISSICERSFLEELQPVEQLINCETVKGMKCQMMDILRKVCEYIVIKNKTDNHQLRDSVMKFIENNYYDINLNVSAIGEQFKMTPAYLSKLFKEQAGEGLIEYINKTRMNRAKQLLKEEGINIYDVAKRVGYSDINTFIRIFKKLEGITPGKYRY